MEINTKEKIDLGIDLSWQIGSKTPPKVCLCCGSAFNNNKRKILGPYYELPYIWICSECHEKDYLFCSDKEYVDTDFKEVVKNIEKSKLSIRNKRGNEKLYLDSDFDTVDQVHSLHSKSDKKKNTIFKFIPLIDLKLDADNVRFRHIGNNLSEVKIEELIWKDNDIMMLFRDIRNSLGIIEPLYVDSQFTVIEGNRRLTCLRKIARDIRSDVIKDVPIQYFDPVPCRIIPDDFLGNPKEEFLARIHIGGKKQWRSLDQASHLHELVNKYGMSLDNLSDIVSLNKKMLKDSIRAYEVTSEYHQRHPRDEEWVSKYSYFVELVKKPTLENWLLDKENLFLVMSWIANRQIERGDEIRKIPQIIQNEKALIKMRNGEKIRIAISANESQIKPKNIDTIEKKRSKLSNTTTEQKQNTLEVFLSLAKKIVKEKGTIKGDDLENLIKIRNEINNIINLNEKKP